MEIYGKPMEHLWENDGFGTQNPLAAIGIPCVFHVFPQVSTCYQSIEINIRKTYGVSTTGHQQKFEKAYVVLISIPQVKNHGIAHLPLDDPCLYPPLCDPLPIISILIILIACDWFICHTYLSVGINPCVYHNWKTN